MFSATVAIGEAYLTQSAKLAMRGRRSAELSSVMVRADFPTVGVSRSLRASACV